ncbi:hypothetical protein BDV25DRAFT_154366 [Aspergillus avenaceus]|uniref:Uncharacterized protein n=1 Tax=Aspergillus avenaceus TaxID=36643 RepID=A0A5N6TVM5_ASPAV|nr:hypothetical protein BDV25DRAFT_154366 [Aspergillus avenaceus]
MSGLLPDQLDIEVYHPGRLLCFLYPSYIMIYGVLCKKLYRCLEGHSIVNNPHPETLVLSLSAIYTTHE